ncbi:flagellar associated protein [Carpediemonas membranifera]|uniref:Flagellar associated protein n=1 Tax=Carpediemonas membranifera TaxID=201153 RepID=A0A8J6DZG9_9EUKA|nr:flagellar associated protein [Carpediemonas membranifera]|eukprot:KAG9390386.1 flagellar associated protein [Carpediemonas membranifera]
MSITPPSIKFDVSSNSIYYVDISVQNITVNEPIRVRLSSKTPANPHITAVFLESQKNADPNNPSAGRETRQLSPGLGKIVRIYLDATDPITRTQNDQLIITAQSTSVEAHKEEVVVPIKVVPAHPEFELDQAGLDFGNVLLGQDVEQVVRITNIGPGEGDWELKLESGESPTGCITASPMTGSLGPGESQEVVFTVQGSAVGVLNVVAAFSYASPTADPLPAIHIVINASIVTALVALMHRPTKRARPAPLTAMTLGRVFYNTVVSKTLIVSNPTAVPLDYNLRLRDAAQPEEDDMSTYSAVTVRTRKDVPEATNVSFEPREGTIPPYSEQEVLLKFTPVADENVLEQAQRFINNATADASGGVVTHLEGDNRPPSAIGTETRLARTDADERQYDLALDLIVGATGQVMAVPFTATAVRPHVVLSTNKLAFGPVIVGAERTMSFTLTNKSERVNVPVEVLKMPHAFSIRPEVTSLGRLQSVDFHVTFIPKSLAPVPKNAAIVLRLAKCIDLQVALTGSGQYGMGKDNRSRASTRTPLTKRMLSGGTHNRLVDQNATLGATKPTYLAKKAKEAASKRSAFDPISTLREPVLEMPKVDAAVTGGTGVVGQAPVLSRPRLDEIRKLVKAKFKSEPTLDAEMEGCSKMVDEAILSRVTTGPRHFDYGVLTVMSSETLSFNVANDNSHAVKVSLHCDGDDQVVVRPKSQVLNPGNMAGFDITVSCHTPVDAFSRVITVAINDQQCFQLSVVAVVRPVRVVPSVRELMFSLSSGNMFDRVVPKQLVLRNEGNTIAQWSASVTSEDFNVIPASGEIPANSDRPVDIQWLPGAKASLDESVNFDVVGGETVSVAVKASITPADLRVLAQALPFGVISVGMEKTLKVTLKNPRSTEAYYQVGSAVSAISVTPKQGCVPGGTTAELTVTILSNKAQVLDTPITIGVRGGAKQTLQLTADIQVPDIRVTSGLPIDFGRVPVCLTVTKSVQLKNNSPIPALLFVDFSNTPEFAIHIPYDADRDAIAPVTKGQMEAELSGRPDEGHGERSEDTMESVHLVRVILAQMGEVSLDVAFTPAGDVTHDFRLPITVAGLPQPPVHLEQARILATSTRPQLLVSRHLINFGVRPVSASNIAGKHSVYKAGIELSNPSSTPVPFCGLFPEDSCFSASPQHGVVEPHSSEQLTITFHPVFHARSVQQQLTLHYGPIANDFMRPTAGNGPPDRKEAQRKADEAAIDGYRPHVVDLRGVPHEPCITFDRQHVVLPTVPVGVPAMATFHIINVGHQSSEIRCILPPDTSRTPLLVTFPKGNLLAYNIASIPVTVSFASKKPISFTAKLEFADPSGKKAAVFISGTTDTSLMMALPFIMGHKNLLTLKSVPGKPIVAQLPRNGLTLEPDVISDAAAVVASGQTTFSRMFVAGAADGTVPLDHPILKSQYAGLAVLAKDVPIPVSHRDAYKVRAGVLSDLLSRFVTAALSDVSETAVKPVIPWAFPCGAGVEDDLSSAMLLKYLGTLYPRLFAIGDNPAALADNPTIAVELVEALTGRPIQTKTLPRTGTIDQRVDANLSLIDGILVSLKSHGALINHVMPASLLPQKEFIHHCQRTVGSGDVVPPVIVSVRMNAVFSQVWEIVAPSAWSSILYQLIKLFAMNAVKPLPATPGAKLVAARLPAASGSNIYSAQELNLLNWINLTAYEFIYGPVKEEEFPADAAKVLQRIIVSKGEKVDTDVPLEVSLYAASKRIVYTTFDALSDCIAFAAAMLKNVPSLSVLKRALVACLLGRDLVNISDFEPGLRTYAEKMDTPDYDPERLTADLQSAVCDAMTRLKLDLGAVPADISKGSARDMAIFALYLNQRMAAFAPKLTLSFSAKLNEPLVKHVKLTNPTKKQAQYSVSMTGTGDFTSDSELVKIESKATVEFPVTFTPVFSKPTTGRLVFTPHKIGAAPYPEPMVIELIGEVEPGTPIDTVKEICKVYETRTIDLAIKSPFTRKGQFDVRLGQSRDTTAITVRPNATDAKAIAMRARQRIEGRLVTPDAFTLGTSSKTVSLEPGEKKTHRMRLRFHPLQPGAYHAILTFSDDALGEFTYAVSGTAVLPDPTDTYHLTTTSEETQRDIDLPWDNPIVKRLNGMPGLPVIQQAFKDSDSLDYAVEFSADHVGGPPEVTLYNPSKRTAGQETQPNLYPLKVKALSAGTYPVRMTMRSAYDVRVADIELTVHEPGVDMHIEFEARVRDVISQKIPVHNSSTKEIAYKVLLTGEGFTGNSGFRVGPGGSTNYDLTFTPKRTGLHEGKLVLINQESGAESTCTLVAEVDDPAAEDYLTIEATARQPEERTIDVVNPFDHPVTYAVSCDEEWITGPTALNVPSKGTAPYTFQVLTNRATAVRGTITFTAPSGQFVWYAIELHATPPQPEAAITLQTKCHEPISTELTITNPADWAAQFSVDINGPALYGDSVVMIGPRESVSYQIVYSPMIPGSSRGSISFISDSEDFWFELNLEAEVADPVAMPAFSAEIGSTQTQAVTLDNPLATAVKYYVHNTNPQNYATVPAGDIIVPAQGTVHVEFVYTPTSITATETGRISFKSRTAGEYVYDVTGNGMPPSEQVPIRTLAQPGATNTTMVMFKNPFPKSLHTSVSLISDTPDAWQLMMKKPDHVVTPPFGSLQVPVCFFAPTMAQFKATVRITDLNSDDDVPLAWDSPIIGIADIPATGRTTKLVTRARSELRHKANFELYRLAETWTDSRDALPFAASLRFPDDDESMIAQTLSVSPTMFTMVRGEVEVPLQFTFKPLRSMSSPVELIIEDTSRGGRWHFDLLVTATVPDIDDTISIAAAPNTSGLVTLALNNVHSAYSPFAATFTPESPVEFAVEPPNGVLEPAGSTPTQLTISYSPTSYGNPQAGILVVTTDRMEWRYQVKGSFPTYEVPEAKSRIREIIQPTASHPGSSAANRARKNFMSRNITSVKGRKASATMLRRTSTNATLQ